MQYDCCFYRKNPYGETYARSMKMKTQIGMTQKSRKNKDGQQTSRSRGEAWGTVSLTDSEGPTLLIPWSQTSSL